MFKRLKDNGEELTSSEYLCLECIELLNKPTISEFADFFALSSPNATYRVKSLINKGFISKEKSKKDGREYILVPTEKYYKLFSAKDTEETLKNIKSSLNEDESDKFDEIIKILSKKKKERKVRLSLRKKQVRI